MNGRPTAPGDSSRPALEFIHRLLVAPNAGQPALDDLLAELAAVFAVPTAGLAALPDGTPLALHPAPAGTALAENRPSWCDDSEFLARLQRARSALTLPLPAGGSCLITAVPTPERGAWLLWLQDANRREWTASEAAALLLIGQTLARGLTDDEALPRWAKQLGRGLRQQRLEAVARAVRRLAHDFGNVLTGILGFSELALAQQVSSSTPLHAYLTEVYRSAQNGAQYTNQLRLFARRQSSSSRFSALSAVLADEETRLRPLLGTDVQLAVELPVDLPAVALDAEHLRQVLAVLLDNAREAISGSGTITVSARTIQLSAADTHDWFGDLRPGAHLEISIADTGAGLTLEVERQLFTEPFFSAKPRKRGLGLAIAYGILAAHHGGLELVRSQERGTIAHIVVPVVTDTVPPPSHPPASPQPARTDKVLVVDDDPMILQFVTTTLERAGFRVQAAANAEDALRTYTAAANDPFRLVLADILMPQVNGVDLAKRLLAHDAEVRVLFMSGQVPAEFTKQELAPGQFELLPKPFRPEGLVRAVRAALERVVPRRTAPAGASPPRGPAAPRTSPR